MEIFPRMVVMVLKQMEMAPILYTPLTEQRDVYCSPPTPQSPFEWFQNRTLKNALLKTHRIGANPENWDLVIPGPGLKKIGAFRKSGSFRNPQPQVFPQK